MCNNDTAGTARVVFNHMASAEVATGPVPPGGTVYVFLTESRLKIIGGFGLPFLNAERLLVGVATIGPFRSRTGI